MEIWERTERKQGIKKKVKMREITELILKEGSQMERNIIEVKEGKLVYEGRVGGRESKEERSIIEVKGCKEGRKRREEGKK